MAKNRQIGRVLLEHIIKSLAEENFYAMTNEERSAKANSWLDHFEDVLNRNFQETQCESFIAYYDGSAKPNPGDMHIGGYIKNNAGDTIWTMSKSAGFGTNNQAEYLALLEVSKKLVELGAKEAKIYGDSQLTVNQVNGKWQVKDQKMVNLHKLVKQNFSQIDKVKLKWVQRNQNSLADKLSKG